MSDPVKLLLANVQEITHNTFKLMDACEEVLESRGASRARLPGGGSLFSVCRPLPRMFEYPLWLYRAHVNQMVDRFDAEEDPHPLTDAEMATVFSDASLAGPMTDRRKRLYWYCFSRSAPSAVVSEFSVSDEWDPTVDSADLAELEALRSKFTAVLRRP